jgi:hypothetical protein
MFDLTVDVAHTYFVGVGGWPHIGGWLVHNCGKGVTEPGNRGAKFSGKIHDSAEDAFRAAQRYASKNKSCTFRGLCSRGDHYHVDKTINGRLVHTRHYYFK